ncbi:MAG: TIGR01777 family oxidoreductase [Verrucomicrobiota bacterium]|jgi:hypothetical protein
MDERQRIIVTGASGLIGSALCRRLADLGYVVVAYHSRHDGAYGMNQSKGTIDKQGLEGVFAVIHLAGESIAQRWTQAARERILTSRRENTRLLAATLAQLKNKPEVFISMSGINRYGLHRTETLTEESAPMVDGFLPAVTEAWENATLPAQQAGIRTVLLRTAMVLSRHQGGLSKMLPAFQLGLGGPIGGGRQRLSWIGLPDLVELILWTLRNPTIHGPLNAVSPQPLSQAEFAHHLGRALRRPACLPLPAWAISFLFGAMGRETILSDLAVSPAVALASGFRFTTPDLPAALAAAWRE